MSKKFSTYESHTNYHSVSFSKDEIIEIIKNHMRSLGENIPEGRDILIGLENRYPDQDKLILRIDK